MIKIENIISPSMNLKCCRKDIGEFNKITLGFGEKKPANNDRIISEYYGEVEILTYFADWKIFSNGDKIFSKSTINEHVKRFYDFKIGNLLNIIEISRNNIDIMLSNDTVLSILRNCSVEDQDDEYVHIFIYDVGYYGFSYNSGWIFDPLL